MIIHKGEIDIKDNWQIGLIVGKSGTGKTTIAKKLFGNAYITNFEYSLFHKKNPATFKWPGF